MDVLGLPELGLMKTWWGNGKGKNRLCALLQKIADHCVQRSVSAVFGNCIPTQQTQQLNARR